ncbi:MAG: hypothetical protein ACOX2W_12940 [Desulfomonilia bacterium]
MTLVLRKMLSSSTFAIAGALEALAHKLERRLKEDNKLSQAERNLEDDLEIYDELADELDVSDEEQPDPLSPYERRVIEDEMSELHSFFELAMTITHNAKGEALLHALRVGIFHGR